MSNVEHASEPDDAAEFRAWYDAATLERVPAIAVGLVLVHLLHIVLFKWFVAPIPADAAWRQGILVLHTIQAFGVGAAGLWVARRWRQHRDPVSGRRALLLLFVGYLTFGALVSGVDQLHGIAAIAMLTATVGVAVLAELSLAEAAVVFGGVGLLGLGTVWALHPGGPGRVSVAVNMLAMGGLGFGVSQVLSQRRRAGWRRRRETEAVTQELSQLNARLTEEIARRTMIEAELEVLVNRDPLTALQNRRGFLAALREISPSPRGDGLLLVDLDHFKAVNDALGHAAGDETLVRVASLLTNSVRTDDVVARLGGEELAILLPHTPMTEAERLANRLREAIAEAGLGRPDHPLTVSLGVAMAHDGEAWEEWLARADAALYAAKESGRNRVCLAEDTADPPSQ